MDVPVPAEEGWRGDEGGCRYDGLVGVGVGDGRGGEDDPKGGGKKAFPVLMGGEDIRDARQGDE
jgi:hypothetical protein